MRETSIVPDASGEPSCDLLQQPLVAVRIVERCPGLVGPVLGVSPRDSSAGKVEDLAHLDPFRLQGGPSRVDVRNGQDYALRRARLGVG